MAAPGSQCGTACLPDLLDLTWRSLPHPCRDKMIDAPTYLQAQNLLTFAERVGTDTGAASDTEP